MVKDQQPTANHTDAMAPVITFDGPSGSGKGTLSRAVAANLGWHLLDSGALYRLVALSAHRDNLDPQNRAHVDRAADLAGAMNIQFLVAADGNSQQTLLAGEDVSRAIRSEAVGNLASYFAAEPKIRSQLLKLQQAFRQSPGLVADGRDMGTVVFKDAHTKIFVTASARERAERRCAQLSQNGMDVKIDKIYREILARDERDAERRHSPLKPAEDAVVLDTTEHTVDETLAHINRLLQDKGLALQDS